MSIILSSKRELVVSGTVILGSAIALMTPGSAAMSAAANVPVVASAAKSMSISETATMRPIGRPGRIINERGTISGTDRGSIEAQLVRITNGTGEATITTYTSGGSLKAHATTHARAEGATAYFHGIATITSGTGTWAHASGSLAFNGTTDRQNLHTTAEMHGTLNV